MPQAVEKPVELLTRRDLCAWFDCTAGTIWKWERKGMPVIRYGRKLRLYRIADVIAWVEREDAP